MMLCTRNLRFANMRDEEEIFQTNLERCSYRFLQQTAKAMGLPSNVKKLYLIQLINTKNYASPRELDLLVRHIREEQKHRSLVRRMSPKNRRKRIDYQSPEISSTNNGLSPPISKTPQTSQVYVQYSPEVHSPMKYPQTVSARRLPITSSDRVLRSSNRVTKPSYLLNNTLLTLLKEPDSDKRTESRVKIISVDENKKKAASRIFAKKIIESWQSEGNLAMIPRSEDISPPLGKRARRLSGVYPLQPEDIKLPNVAVRRADGSISQLNAIIQKPLPQRSFSYDRQTQTDSVTRSLLRAHVTPPVISTQNPTFRSLNSSEINTSVNYRAPFSSSIIATLSNMTAFSPSFSNRPSNVSGTTPTLTVATSNISEIVPNGYRTSDGTEVSPNNSHTLRIDSTQMTQNNIRLSSSSDETTLSSTSKDSTQHSREYYHKKIRAEKVRSTLRSRDVALAVTGVENECRLPRINEVFSKFNSVYSGNITRPLYVQVDTEQGMAPNPAHIPDPRCQYQGSSTLETIYNLKLPYQPTLQICTTNNTYSVYCTHVMSTAKAHPSSNAVHSVYDVSSPPRENQPYYTNEYEIVPRANDFFSNFHYHELNNNIDAPTLDFQRSCSSVETVTSQEQELGANITIPEMVEDALEIISQDGDYMERMGMDIRMQCILCNWAGPKIILEYHIRKEHPKEIVEAASRELSASYTLGGLCARRLWHCRVLQLRGALYVLSAKYDDPDCFMAALSTISYNPDDPKTGSLTIYNKVTGEPFTWTGAITDLHPSMPYENDPNCLRLQLSKMDLLPNSANLKLLNRELVSRSPTKVVVGQPELDNIHISLSVKIFN